ncbi:proline-rich protein HaeIII subfamily 1-like [Formica exsecta]|uniref:proline-rich protein HaeIII subfamily 1-like n=1 Tax=Formica exsecta TaxID=72781 RepID=UPI0011439B63|nr:proline-rich protein HaeIII subfamily 1-like [Formica exsecta]
MSQPDDILAAINELLDDPLFAYDPPLPGPSDQQKPPPSSRPPNGPATRPPSRPPRIGTLIQRSDRVNQRKMEQLMQAPPPPPARPRRPATAPARTKPRETTTSEDQPPQLLMPTGPLPPPPIRVQVEPGIIFDVLHFAVHVSRKYKVRSFQGHWVMRFSKTVRRLENRLDP